jgi:nitric oxide reductase large subunit
MKIHPEPETFRVSERGRAFMRRITLHQAALGVIAILAVVLMVEASGSAASTRKRPDSESQSDGNE